MFGRWRSPAEPADPRVVSTPIWPGDRVCSQLMPPLRDALIVTEDARCIVPDPRGGIAIVPIGTGLALGWTPTPEFGGVTLVAFTAIGPDAGFATTVTRPALRALIADLQAIDAQLETEHG